jgi:hypothetical protein
VLGAWWVQCRYPMVALVWFGTVRRVFARRTSFVCSAVGRLSVLSVNLLPAGYFASCGLLHGQARKAPPYLAAAPPSLFPKMFSRNQESGQAAQNVPKVLPRIPLPCPHSNRPSTHAPHQAHHITRPRESERLESLRLTSERARYAFLANSLEVRPSSKVVRNCLVGTMTFCDVAFFLSPVKPAWGVSFAILAKRARASGCDLGRLIPARCCGGAGTVESGVMGVRPLGRGLGPEGGRYGCAADKLGRVEFLIFGEDGEGEGQSVVCIELGEVLQDEEAETMVDGQDGSEEDPSEP